MKTQLEILKHKLEKDVVLIQTYLDNKVIKNKWCPTKYEKKIYTLNGIIKVIDMHMDLELIMDEEICNCTKATVSDVFNLVLDGTPVNEISAKLSDLYPHSPQRCGMCTIKISELATTISNIT